MMEGNNNAAATTGTRSTITTNSATTSITMEENTTAAAAVNDDDAGVVHEALAPTAPPVAKVDPNRKPKADDAARPPKPPSVIPLPSIVVAASGTNGTTTTLQHLRRTAAAGALVAVQQQQQQKQQQNKLRSVGALFHTEQQQQVPGDSAANNINPFPRPMSDVPTFAKSDTTSMHARAAKEGTNGPLQPHRHDTDVTLPPALQQQRQHNIKAQKTPYAAARRQRVRPPPPLATTPAALAAGGAARAALCTWPGCTRDALLKVTPSATSERMLSDERHMYERTNGKARPGPPSSLAVAEAVRKLRLAVVLQEQKHMYATSTLINRRHGLQTHLHSQRHQIEAIGAYCAAHERHVAKAWTEKRPMGKRQSTARAARLVHEVFLPSAHTQPSIMKTHEPLSSSLQHHDKPHHQRRMLITAGTTPRQDHFQRPGGILYKGFTGKIRGGDLIRCLKDRVRQQHAQEWWAERHTRQQRRKHRHDDCRTHVRRKFAHPQSFALRKIVKQFAENRHSARDIGKGPAVAVVAYYNLLNHLDAKKKKQPSQQSGAAIHMADGDNPVARNDDGDGSCGTNQVTGSETTPSLAQRQERVQAVTASGIFQSTLAVAETYRRRSHAAYSTGCTEAAIETCTAVKCNAKAVGDWGYCAAHVALQPVVSFADETLQRSRHLQRPKSREPELNVMMPEDRRQRERFARKQRLAEYAAEAERAIVAGNIAAPVDQFAPLRHVVKLRTPAGLLQEDRTRAAQTPSSLEDRQMPQSKWRSLPALGGKKEPFIRQEGINALKKALLEVQEALRKTSMGNGPVDASAGSSGDESGGSTGICDGDTRPRSSAEKVGSDRWKSKVLRDIIALATAAGDGTPSSVASLAQAYDPWATDSLFQEGDEASLTAANTASSSLDAFLAAVVDIAAADEREGTRKKKERLRSINERTGSRKRGTRRDTMRPKKEKQHKDENLSAGTLRRFRRRLAVMVLNAQRRYGTADHTSARRRVGRLTTSQLSSLRHLLRQRPSLRSLLKHHILLEQDVDEHVKFKQAGKIVESSLSERPSPEQLVKRRILRGDDDASISQRAKRLSSVLSRRPSASLLRNQHILPTKEEEAALMALLSRASVSHSGSDDDVHVAMEPSDFLSRPRTASLTDRQRKLEAALMHRLREEELHERHILLSQEELDHDIEERARKAMHISHMLAERPDARSLIEKHILLHRPFTVEPGFERHQIKFEMEHRKSEISQHLKRRPSLADLKEATEGMLSGVLLEDVVEEHRTAVGTDDAENVDGGLKPNAPSSHNLAAVTSTRLTIDRILSQAKAQQQRKNLRMGDPGALYCWCLPPALSEGEDMGAATGSHSTQAPVLPIQALAKEVITSISCGERHIISCTNMGMVFTWGANDHGQLGLGDTVARNVPYSIHFQASPIYAERAAFVAAGARASALITKGGRDVYTWGDNRTHCELGLGGDKALGMGNSDSGPLQILPTKVVDLTGCKCTCIALGDSHGAAINSRGDMWTWGRGSRGQLGHVLPEDGDSSEAYVEDRPRCLKNYGEFWCDIACGPDYCVSLAYDGNVYSWGSNEHGQLGQPAKHDQYTPKIVMSLWRKGVQRVYCGKTKSVALTEDGHLYCTRNSALDSGASESAAGDAATKEYAQFERLKPHHLVRAAAITGDCVVAVSFRGSVLTWEHFMCVNEDMRLQEASLRDISISADAVFGIGSRTVPCGEEKGQVSRRRSTMLQRVTEVSELESMVQFLPDAIRSSLSVDGVDITAFLDEPKEHFI